MTVDPARPPVYLGRAVVWIETTVERERTMRADPEKVLELIMDVPTSGPLFPGVDQIVPLGDDTYRWELTERRTLGSSFRGVYKAQYQRSGSEIRWKTQEGNIQVEGIWRVSGPPGAAKVTVRVTTGLDAPVPKILKKPATLFAEMEAKNGLAKQLEGLEARVRR